MELLARTFPTKFLIVSLSWILVPRIPFQIDSAGLAQTCKRLHLALVFIGKALQLLVANIDSVGAAQVARSLEVMLLMLGR
jgi:hypothetical protein